MSMTYQEALSYLDAKDVFAARLGLERMRKLHEEMDLGEAKSTVHVAGTNGKGSVSAFLASIMASGGMRVGLYTSPHVLDVKERLVSGEGMITDEEFALGMDEVRSAEEKAGENVSYFEVLTALFFWWAKEKNLDHTVLETGLGGRLDATNIVIPRLSVITPISLEHTKQLGSTYAEIAAEKAAIIKHGRPTVMSPMHPDASSVVEKRCEEVLSPLIKADRYVDMRLVSALEKRGNRWGQVVEVVTTLGDYGEVFIPLLGSHQRLNAVTAIRSAEVLRRQGAKLTDRQIRHGIQETLWPARLEFIEKPMPIVLDVTHNPHGAVTLVKELMRLMTQLEMDSLVIVVGIMEDKNVDGVLGELTRLRGTLVCTQPKCPRAMDSSVLSAKAREIGGTGLAVENVPDVGAAVDKAMTRGDLVCVTGSFYTVSEAMSHLGLRPHILRNF